MGITDPTPMPGRRFSFWLAQTLMDDREKAGIPRSVIASVLDVNERTVEYFEAVDDPETKGYSQNLDRIVAAYAYALGIEDARELWHKALKRWKREGSAPDFTSDLPGAGFLRPIRDEHRRTGQGRGEPEEKRHANGSH